MCLDPFVKLSIVDMLKCTIHTRFYGLDLVFMNSRSKQVYFIPMYIRYVLDIHTCFKLAIQTYFDYPIHVLEKSSLIKNTSVGF